MILECSTDLHLNYAIAYGSVKSFVSRPLDLMLLEGVRKGLRERGGLTLDDFCGPDKLIPEEDKSFLWCWLLRLERLKLVTMQGPRIMGLKPAAMHTLKHGMFLEKRTGLWEMWWCEHALLRGPYLLNVAPVSLPRHPKMEKQINPWRKENMRKRFKNKAYFIKLPRENGLIWPDFYKEMLTGQTPKYKVRLTLRGQGDSALLMLEGSLGKDVRINHSRLLRGMNDERLWRAMSRKIGSHRVVGKTLGVGFDELLPGELLGFRRDVALKGVFLDDGTHFDAAEAREVPIRAYDWDAQQWVDKIWQQATPESEDRLRSLLSEKFAGYAHVKLPQLKRTVSEPEEPSQRFFTLRRQYLSSLLQGAAIALVPHLRGDVTLLLRALVQLLETEAISDPKMFYNQWLVTVEQMLSESDEAFESLACIDRDLLGTAAIPPLEHMAEICSTMYRRDPRSRELSRFSILGRKSVRRICRAMTADMARFPRPFQQTRQTRVHPVTRLVEVLWAHGAEKVERVGQILQRLNEAKSEVHLKKTLQNISQALVPLVPYQQPRELLVNPPADLTRTFMDWMDQLVSARTRQFAVFWLAGNDAGHCRFLVSALRHYLAGQVFFPCLSSKNDPKSLPGDMGALMSVEGPILMGLGMTSEQMVGSFNPLIWRQVEDLCNQRHKATGPVLLLMHGPEHQASQLARQIKVPIHVHRIPQTLAVLDLDDTASHVLAELFELSEEGALEEFRGDLAQVLAYNRTGTGFGEALLETLSPSSVRVLISYVASKGLGGVESMFEPALAHEVLTELMGRPFDLDEPAFRQLLTLPWRASYKWSRKRRIRLIDNLAHLALHFGPRAHLLLNDVLSHPCLETDLAESANILALWLGYFQGYKGQQLPRAVFERRWSLHERDHDGLFLLLRVGPRLAPEGFEIRAFYQSVLKQFLPGPLSPRIGRLLRAYFHKGGSENSQWARSLLEASTLAGLQDPSTNDRWRESWLYLHELGTYGRELTQIALTKMVADPAYACSCTPVFKRLSVCPESGPALQAPMSALLEEADALQQDWIRLWLIYAIQYGQTASLNPKAIQWLQGAGPNHALWPRVWQMLWQKGADRGLLIELGAQWLLSARIDHPKRGVMAHRVVKHAGVSKINILKGYFRQWLHHPSLDAKVWFQLWVLLSNSEGNGGPVSKRHQRRLQRRFWDEQGNKPKLSLEDPAWILFWKKLWQLDRMHRPRLWPWGVAWFSEQESDNPAVSRLLPADFVSSLPN